MKLNKTEKILFYITMIVVITGFSYAYIIYPQINKINYINDSLVKKRIELNKNLNLIKQMDRLENNYLNIKPKLNFEKSPENQLAVFQINLEKLFREIGNIQIKSISPLPIISGFQKNKNLSIQIDLNCNIRNLCELLFKINNLPVLVNIRKLQVYSDNEISPNINIVLSVDSLWIKKND